MTPVTEMVEQADVDTAQQSSGITLLNPASAYPAMTLLHLPHDAERAPLQELDQHKVTDGPLYSRDVMSGPQCLCEASLSTDCPPSPERQDAKKLNSVCFMELHDSQKDECWTTDSEFDEDMEWFGPDDREGDEGARVICRSALPRGSRHFEQVLDEVAPDVRAVQVTCPTFTCPVSLLNEMDEGEGIEGCGRQGGQRTGKRLSWADQRGLPLTAQLLYQH